MAQKRVTSSVPRAQFCFLLWLALVISMLCRVTCIVTIRNWTAFTTITVTPSPDGNTDELEPVEWMQYTCTGNGRSGMFTIANHKSDNVVTLLLYDGQNVALVDNISDSIDGILVDDKGRKIQTLFINL
ncbi:hypothetical protein M758_12G160400 [Ceratodon purpureus]|uniref:Uncharacterized protein n=1 Tax=Ceratodon purpureus TaxID=3225 RepID=A0A8T0G7H4_CERPU|nr:hypothetical protein KC19_12G157700 [Ceratodon purpureus]KAG0599544.1 hypothetical protein M758_12G160400 [Ceratodon purpureus]